MSTSGLVITLDDDPDQAATAVREVLLAGPLTLGEVLGHRIAVALEADTPAEAESWRRWLAVVPGVVAVDSAFVHAGEKAAHAG